MDRQLKRIVWALLCLLVFVAAISMIAFAPFLRMKPALPPKLSNIQNETLDGIDIESILEWDEAYMAVYYPRTENGQVNAAVLRYVGDAVAAFKAGMTPSRRGEKDEFSISFRVSRFDADVVSFLFRSYTHYAGAARDSESTRAMTVDLASGQELGLAALFASEDCLEVLADKASDQLNKRVAPTVETFERFILDGHTLRFYLAGGSFELPLQEVKALLRLRFGKGLPEPTRPEPPQYTTLPAAPAPDIAGLEGKKILALTFDDGPHPQNTPKLLDLLKKEGVPATFFFLGCWVESTPDIVLRAAAEGHQIASHTYRHKDLTKLAPDKRGSEIRKAARLIKDTVGYLPGIMRPPYGTYNDDVKAAAGTPLLLWSLDPRDWEVRDAEKVSAKIVKTAKDGDIIILHDIYESSVRAAKLVIPALKAKGFVFVTVDQMMALRGGAKAGEVVRNRPPATEEATE